MRDCLYACGELCSQKWRGDFAIKVCEREVDRRLASVVVRASASSVLLEPLLEGLGRPSRMVPVAEAVVGARAEQSKDAGREGRALHNKAAGSGPRPVRSSLALGDKLNASRPLVQSLLGIRRSFDQSSSVEEGGRDRTRLGRGVDRDGIEGTGQ